MSERIDMITERLQTLNPASLDIEDNSAAHAGHEGAKAGGGHFTVHIVSEQFDGKTLVERHRMVYDAIGDAMESEIHALSIKAKSPAEVQA